MCKIEAAPKVDAAEMRILRSEEIVAVLRGLQGQDMQAPAVVGLFTGMRLGEVLALRWGNTDLDQGIIRVREALEETEANGIRFKQPKTKRGRRNITLPDLVLRTLREHRRRLLELRLQLGLGKLAEEDLVFPTINGGPRSPSAVSRQWGLVAAGLGMPDVTFHALRHTHASQLIDAGVDPVTITRA